MNPKCPNPICDRTMELFDIIIDYTKNEYIYCYKCLCGRKLKIRTECVF